MLGTVAEQLKAARRVSTPLVAITTADPPATVTSILRAYNGSAPPILQWDLIRGVVGLNEAGRAARQSIVEEGTEGMPGTPLQSPAEALAKAAELPERCLLFALNAGRILENEAVIQAICNLRDAYKANGRTLVLLSPQITLPPELVQDVRTIDEPLPTETEVRAIIAGELKNARETMKTPPAEPDDETMRRAVEALAGLASFPIEQATAVSLDSAKRLDLDQLWDRKRQFIDQTRGLTVDRWSITFNDLGGLAEAKRHGDEIFGGPEPPAVIVRIEEIEKMLAGSAGDTSGTSQDAVGQILGEMEDMKWTGLIAVGPPGSGKTAFCQSLGTSHSVPTFALDLGAAKGSLVGQSEERIRQVLKVIKAVAGKRAYMVATCNAITAGVITPALLRRFTDGIWYFDLPTREEKDAIWPINLAQFGHPLDSVRPSDTDWTGAEIRNCCRLAYRRRCSLVDAAKSIVPVAVADPASLNKLRDLAHGKFLSASYAGTYVHAKAPKAPTTAARSYEES